jgi:L-threonylcarbamoyladenylate synthase
MSRWHLREAVRILHAGGVIAYPTEAVYGLGCDPQDAAAVERVLSLKHRPVAKGVILIACDIAQLEGYVNLKPSLYARISGSWPGPATWLLPAGPRARPWLTGGRDTLAVRVTAHPQASELCRAFGDPLVSTSANLGGRRPARTALEVRVRIGARALDLILPGKTGPQRNPTEIRDARSGAIVRANTGPSRGR